MDVSALQSIRPIIVPQSHITGTSHVENKITDLIGESLFESIGFEKGDVTPTEEVKLCIESRKGQIDLN